MHSSFFLDSGGMYTVQRKILTGANFMDTDSIFKYLTENILMDGHCLSPYTCKHCIVFKQFDRLNFDGLAGRHQKHQNFPHQNVYIATLCYSYAANYTALYIV